MAKQHLRDAERGKDDPAAQAALLPREAENPGQPPHQGQRRQRGDEIDQADDLGRIEPQRAQKVHGFLEKKKGARLAETGGIQGLIAPGERHDPPAVGHDGVIGQAPGIER